MGKNLVFLLCFAVGLVDCAVANLTDSENVEPDFLNLSVMNKTDHPLSLPPSDDRMRSRASLLPDAMKIIEITYYKDSLELPIDVDAEPFGSMERRFSSTPKSGDRFSIECATGSPSAISPVIAIGRRSIEDSSPFGKTIPRGRFGSHTSEQQDDVNFNITFWTVNAENIYFLGTSEEETKELPSPLRCIIEWIDETKKEDLKVTFVKDFPLPEAANEADENLAT